MKASNCTHCGDPIWQDPKSGTWRHVGGDRACANAPVATPIPTGGPRTHEPVWDED